MPLCDELRVSGSRWAAASLEMYTADEPDRDFAVHHMAVAVEHVCKSYLSSITEVLLIEDKPNIGDLLLLAGRGDKTNRQQSDMRTIGGGAAILRAEKLSGKPPADPENLRRLRETRNGITHIGQGLNPATYRALLAAGIDFINQLLGEMGHSPDAFWRDRKSLADQITTAAVTDLRLRYESKIERARRTFARRFGAMRGPERDEAISALSSVPVLTRWFMVSPEKCPACGSPAMVSGRDYSEDFGSFFAPRFFGCRVCDLRLEGEELKLAGFQPISLDDREVDEDYEPDEHYGEEYDGGDMDIEDRHSGPPE